VKRTILRDTVRIALEKLPRHSQLLYYPHFTFIVQGNKIIEWGMNSEGVPPIHLGYNERIQWGMPKVHSEYNAYRKAKGILQSNKTFEIVNIRLNRSQQMRMSAPCECCYAFLGELGCTRCYFSTDCGEFANMKVA
jgi:tRNA(Arg) A34 adenosine deaminase TadA